MCLHNWFHLKCHFTKTALIFYHLHPFFQSKSKYGYHEMPLCNVCNVCLQNWFNLFVISHGLFLKGFTYKHSFMQSQSKDQDMPFCYVYNVCLQNWFHHKCHYTTTAHLRFHLHTFFLANQIKVIRKCLFAMCTMCFCSNDYISNVI